MITAMVAELAGKLAKRVIALLVYVSDKCRLPDCLPRTKSFTHRKVHFNGENFTA